MLILILILLLCFSINSYSQENNQPFENWLLEFKHKAVDQGINPAIAENALSNIKFLEQVIALDRKQPEKTISFSAYLKNVVTSTRIKKARNLLYQNKDILQDIYKKYKVQPRFIIALWGMETDFGRNTGNFYVPESLATLAYEGRRKEFFTEELLNSLRILDEGHITQTNMIGSWAGAMGQTQFMPSSFIKYAVDYDGDGKRDIWKNKKDALASIANYLSTIDWDDSLTWGRKVTIPNDFDTSLADVKIEKTLLEWNNLGIRNLSGGALPKRDVVASLVIPGEEKEGAFLIYNNYKKLLDWNRSLYFATAVGILSDSIK